MRIDKLATGKKERTRLHLEELMRVGIMYGLVKEIIGIVILANIPLLNHCGDKTNQFKTTLCPLIPHTFLKAPMATAVGR